MNRHKLVKNVGKLKVWQTRLAGYMGIINFVMIFYLYVIESPMGFEWYHWTIIIGISIVSIIFMDIRYILPAASAYGFEKNPKFVSLEEMVKSNSKKLDVIIKEIEK